MNKTELPSSDRSVDVWLACKRYSFRLNDCLSWIVEPTNPAAGNPWIWSMDYPDAFTDRTGIPEMLEQ